MATYVCEHCRLQFPSFEDLRKHQEIALHSAGAFDAWICPECDQRFTSPGQLKEHEEKAH